MKPMCYVLLAFLTTAFSCMGQLNADDLQTAGMLEAHPLQNPVEKASCLYPLHDSVAFVAPRWRRSGLQVRVAVTLESVKVSPIELYLFGVSPQRNLDLVPRLAGQELEFLGRLKDSRWYRYAIPDDLLEQAIADGADLVVESLLGDWTFRLTAGYFAGFAAVARRAYKVPTHAELEQ